jgi:glycosyltransferase involved in cell wall biosynthesis
MNKSIVIGIPNLAVFGGTEMQTLTLARYLILNGYKATVCCYFLYDKNIIDKLKSLNIDVVCLKLSPDNLMNVFFSLYSYFKQNKHNIVHIQYVAPGLIPIMTAKFAGVKNIFATVHQPYNNDFKSRLFLRFGASLCKAFICVSKATERSWFGSSVLYEKVNSKRRHFTIYNGIDLSEIDSAIESSSADFQKNKECLINKRIVGVVARLRTEKGYALLLDAMSIVIKALPDAVLVAIGDGPEKSALLNIAEELGINDNILWLGALESAEVFRYYKIMNVVAVPSVFEGFGLSAAEAMAVGRPVVATKVGGLVEVIEDGITGYLVSPDKEMLAGKLIEILGNSNTAYIMGMYGRKRVEQLFSVQKFSRSMISVYELYSA